MGVHVGAQGVRIMTYPVAGPGSALLERLDRVPRDGRWRTTHEMNEFLGYAQTNGAYYLLYVTMASRLVERTWFTIQLWRRTDA